MSLSANDAIPTRSDIMLETGEVIECFGKLMSGYLLFMEQSEIVAKSKHMDTILYNGANIVIHVFTMHVYANESLEKICNQCCKSYVCYLEYIEQLDKTNLANNLYISDISIFVYKQTLGELEMPCAENKREILDLLTRVWNILLMWNCPMESDARLAICNIHLNKYVRLLNMIGENNAKLACHGVAGSGDALDYSDAYVYLDYVKCIQEKWEMEENIYFVFLNEYYRELYNLHKSGKLNSRKHILEKMVIFCAHYDAYKPNMDTIRSIVKQLH